MEKTWVLRCPLRWCSYCKTNSSNEFSGILGFVCTSFFRVFQCHFFRSTVEVDERFFLVDAAFASFNHFVLFFFVPWEVRLAGGFARGSCFVCRGAFSFRCSCWFCRASSTTCWRLNWSFFCCFRLEGDLCSRKFGTFFFFPRFVGFFF